MELHLDINFKQLIEIAKQLPKQKWDMLKSEVERQKEVSEAYSYSEIEVFLLNAPTFSQEQLDKVENARTEINKWRIN